MEIVKKKPQGALSQTLNPCSLKTKQNKIFSFELTAHLIHNQVCYQLGKSGIAFIINAVACRGIHTGNKFALGFALLKVF